jgi:hypothetical protein
MKIDVNFDHRIDAGGKDPDSKSATLKKHHQLLWSKPLPSGHEFTLAPESGAYLVHRSELGEFFLASDSISNSIRSHKSKASLISQIPAADLDAFQALGATIGASIIFPGNGINGSATINAARGFNPRVRDRFDLTLECIRRLYAGRPNPLDATLNLYEDFFELFNDFDGYVDFFLLQDLLENQEIKFFLPFEEGFSSTVLPNSVDEYFTFKNNTMNFVAARNLRIATWAEANL